MTAGACYGAGVDIITACDIRYCTSSARFCVKVQNISCICWQPTLDSAITCSARSSHNVVLYVQEVDVAIVADVGTLQRLPPIVGQGDSWQLMWHPCQSVFFLLHVQLTMSRLECIFMTYGST